MATILKDAEDRLDAIVAKGRGITGSVGSGGRTFSAQAQTLALPAGWFLRALLAAPVDDDGEHDDLGGWDRRYEWDWGALAMDPRVGRNPLDGQARRVFRVTLRVGYVGGQGREKYVALLSGTGESAANAVTYAKRRALDDADRIHDALTFQELYTPDSGQALPHILRVALLEEATVQDLGGGRLVCVAPYEVVINRSQTVVHNP